MSEWGEWREHDGGPCPIPNTKAGEYMLRLRNGQEFIEYLRADVAEDHGDWMHIGCDNDIIAYRVRQS